jgi:hypothetical protein
MAPQGLLGRGIEAASLHSRESGPSENLLVGSGSTNGFMGGGGLGGALLGGHLSGAHQASSRVAADLYAMLQQPSAHYIPADVVLLAERVLALASRVLRRDFNDWQREVPARWDAPAVPFSMESRGGYASRGKDLIERLTGQVALDRVIEKASRQWSGHVYNLTSSEGWMVADGIVTSNCDCIHLPVSEAAANDVLTDPMVYFNSLTPAEQDRYFGGPQAQAIRDGAAIDRVINAQRGGATYIADGGRYTMELARKNGGYGYRSEQSRRPTPYQIYQEANGSKTKAIALLRQVGYVTAGPAR